MNEDRAKHASKKIAVVGAGPGGLTAAMILAARGYDVDVFEKADRVGGRNAELELAGGYRFDLGPTFLMMKFVLDRAFELAGKNSADYLDFKRLDPMYRLLFPAFQMDVSDDRPRMEAEVARCFPGEQGGIARFFEREGERFRHIYGCLETDYSSLRAFLSPGFLRAIPYIPFGRTIFQYLGNYFRSERLRLAFTFQSKYLGMSPWECPGFFVILPYVEHQFGIFHVQGGLSEISKAMARVAEGNGARIHLRSPVQQLLVEHGKVNGVRLTDGREVRADATVINADFAHAMQTLVPSGVLKKYAPARLAKKKYSCSTFMLFLGLDRSYPQMAHHSIVFAQDYKRNTREIFTDLRLSDDFSFYVRNSSVTDERVAPAGKSGIYVLVPVPNNKRGIDWASEGPRMRERVLDAIRDRTAMGDVRPHIEVERMVTPADWEDSGVFYGATFNLAHTMNQMLYFRPHNRFEELDNCYLVGGGTHPGSGLPTIYQSGMIAANLIDKEIGVG